MVKNNEDPRNKLRRASFRAMVLSTVCVTDCVASASDSTSFALTVVESELLFS